MANSSPRPAHYSSRSQSGGSWIKNPYLMLGLELFADFIVMFFVMYAMIATLDHLYFNIGNVYMTLMMVAPMALLMLLFMRHMYPDRRLNLLMAAFAVALFLVGWFRDARSVGRG